MPVFEVAHARDLPQRVQVRIRLPVAGMDPEPQEPSAELAVQGRTNSSYCSGLIMFMTQFDIESTSTANAARPLQSLDPPGHRVNCLGDVSEKAPDPVGIIEEVQEDVVARTLSATLSSP